MFLLNEQAFDEKSPFVRRAFFLPTLLTHIFRLPLYQVAKATDVLSNGSYTQVPQAIKVSLFQILELVSFFRKSISKTNP